MELRQEPSEVEAVLGDISNKLNEKEFDRALLSKIVTDHRHSPITSEEVAAKFAVGLETAKKTLQVTTQRGVRHAVHPIHRRYRTDHLALHRKRLGGSWFMDTLIARHKSLSGNRFAHVITNGKYTRVFPCKDKNSETAKNALEDFIDDVGVPQQLWTDSAPEFAGHKTLFKRLSTRERIDHRCAEPGQKNQNHAAEREIGELKKRWKRRRTKKDASK